MKLTKLSLVAVALVSTLGAEALEMSGDMTVTSNSIWRGASGTANSATVQGTLGVEHESGVYAGMWLTGMEVGTEIDLYLGYAKEIAGFGLDVGFVNYITTGNTDTDPDYEYSSDDSGEIYLGISKDVGVELGATLYKEVLAEGDAGDSLIVEFSVSKDFELAYVGAAYGIQTASKIKDDPEFSDFYYTLTVGKEFKSVKGDLAFTYADNDSKDARGENSDAVYGVSYTTSF